MRRIRLVWAAVAATACVAAAGQSASDPLYRKTGDHERSYKFAEASGIDSPYRLYVPASWDGHRRLPLVVILHGSNLNHDAAFDREPAELKGVLEREADKHGFIVVAVEGYKSGSYGNAFPGPLIQYLHPGVMIVHGEDDPVAPIDDSEMMAFLFKKQGIDAVFDPVVKCGHGSSWYVELPKIFDFFDAHAKRH